MAEKKIKNPIVVENYGNVVFVFGRDELGKGKILVDQTFRPYFYVETPLNLPGAVKTIDGKLAVKRVVETPSEVRKLREELKKDGVKTYEADVVYTVRYTIDNFKAPFEQTPIHYVMFDIEVEDSLDYRNTPKPIVSITLYSNFTKTYYTLALTSEKSGTEKKEERWVVKYFKSEKELLKHFQTLVLNLDPDLLVAWNVTYDINYIYNRAKKLGLKLDLSRIETLKKKIKEIEIKGNGAIANDLLTGLLDGKAMIVDKKTNLLVKVFGRAIVDLLQLYKKMQGNKELESYSLEYIAEAEDLPVKKLERGSISKKSLEELIEYNKRDVEVMVALNEKLRIIEFWDEVRRTAGTIWNHFFDYTFGERAVSFKRLVDVYVLRKAKEIGVVLNNAGESNDAKSYAGGFPVLPIPGLHENVVVFDVTSMYPNIIRTYNLSPETLSEFGKITTPTKDLIISWINDAYKSGGLTKEQRDNLLKLSTEIPEKPRKFLSKEQKLGLMPMVVNELYERRKYYKKLKKEAKDPRKKEEYDLKQLSYKLLLNSIYGQMGDKTSRYYKKEVAETVTSFGRALLSWVMRLVSRMGYKVVAGDTDSVFIKLPSEWDEKRVLEEAKKIEERINESFNEFAKLFGVKEHYHEMGLDKFYKRIIFFKKKGGEEAGKKRYVGYVINEEWQETDKFVVKGLIRADLPRITKLVVNKLAEEVLKKGKPLREFMESLNELKKKVINGEIPLEDVVVKVSLKKPSEYKNKNVPQLRGAKLAMKLGLIDAVVPGKYALIPILKNGEDYIAVPVEKLREFEKLVKEGKVKVNWAKLLERSFGQIESGLPLEKRVDTSVVVQKTKTLLEFLKK